MSFYEISKMSKFAYRFYNFVLLSWSIRGQFQRNCIQSSNYTFTCIRCNAYYFQKTGSPSYNFSVVKLFKNVTLQISNFISVSWLIKKKVPIWCNVNFEALFLCFFILRKQPKNEHYTIWGKVLLVKLLRSNLKSGGLQLFLSFF